MRIWGFGAVFQKKKKTSFFGGWEKTNCVIFRRFWPILARVLLSLLEMSALQGFWGRKTGWISYREENWSVSNLEIKTVPQENCFSRFKECKGCPCFQTAGLACRISCLAPRFVAVCLCIDFHLFAHSVSNVNIRTLIFCGLGASHKINRTLLKVFSLLLFYFFLRRNKFTHAETRATQDVVSQDNIERRLSQKHQWVIHWMW